VGKFEKGKSGNPGGRPKEALAARDLARAHTPEAIERLVFWMRSDNAKASVSASVGLINRGWGMPRQELEHLGEGGGPLKVIIDDRWDDKTSS
jgi:hypothetical protein